MKITKKLTGVVTGVFMVFQVAAPTGVAYADPAVETVDQMTESQFGVTPDQLMDMNTNQSAVDHMNDLYSFASSPDVGAEERAGAEVEVVEPELPTDPYKGEHPIQLIPGYNEANNPEPWPVSDPENPIVIDLPMPPDIPSDPPAEEPSPNSWVVLDELDVIPVVTELPMPDTGEAHEPGPAVSEETEDISELNENDDYVPPAEPEVSEDPVWVDPIWPDPSDPVDPELPAEAESGADTGPVVEESEIPVSPFDTMCDEECTALREQLEAEAEAMSRDMTDDEIFAQIEFEIDQGWYANDYIPAEETEPLPEPPPYDDYFEPGWADGPYPSDPWDNGEVPINDNGSKTDPITGEEVYPPPDPLPSD